MQQPEDRVAMGDFGSNVPEARRLACLAGVAVLVWCSASIAARKPAVVAWNDDCSRIWNPAWGGEDVANLIEPRLELVEKLEDNRVHVQDMRKWLSILLKDEYLPDGFDDHVVSATSCMGFRPWEIAPIKAFLERNDNLDYSALCNGLPAEQRRRTSDSSGNALRFETEKYVIQVLDRAKYMDLLIRDKTGKSPTTAAEAVDWFFKLKNDIFDDSVFSFEGWTHPKWAGCSDEEHTFGAVFLRQRLVPCSRGFNKYYWFEWVYFLEEPVVAIRFRKFLKVSAQHIVYPSRFVSRLRFEHGGYFCPSDIE